jgi:hypothetical protein
VTESVYATPKDAALAKLAEWAINDANRDPLVCEAKRAGATYDEITNITGLSSRTIASILKAAGLTNDVLKQQEAPMTSAVTGVRQIPAEAVQFGQAVSIRGNWHRIKRIAHADEGKLVLAGPGVYSRGERELVVEPDRLVTINDNHTNRRPRDI